MVTLSKIYETRVLANIHLTQHQKKVLALVLASSGGTVPDEEISNNRNMTKARQILTKLGLLVIDEKNKYTITDKGQEVAKDENIVDDTGQLTDKGNELAFDKDEKAPEVSESIKSFSTILSMLEADTPPTPPVEQWEVIDKQTDQRVGKPVKSRKAASRKVDRLDNAYGGYRYFARKLV